ncbi:MAG: type VI secretion system baseplate subunit TssG [Bacteroidota bacterium]
MSHRPPSLAPLGSSSDAVDQGVRVTEESGYESRPDGDAASRSAAPEPRVAREAYHYHFVQVIRLLQALVPRSAEIGRGFSYADERIRVTPHEAMVFPASDVHHVTLTAPPAGSEAPAEAAQVAVTFGGLYGVDSPLPYYFYDHLEKSDQPEPLRGLFDLFSHRLYSLFYQACVKYRPAFQSVRRGRDRDAVHDRHTNRFIAFSGLGTPRALADAPIDPLLLTTFAGRLGSWSRNAEGLEALIEAAFAEPVRVVENVPRRVPISERIALGEAKLGETAALGSSVYDESGKFRVELGPLSLTAYESFLPSGTNSTALADLVRLYAPDYLDFEVRLTLAPDAMPTMRLGDPASSTLGSTATLGRQRPEAMTRTFTAEAMTANA